MFVIIRSDPQTQNLSINNTYLDFGLRTEKKSLLSNLMNKAY
jgi:hypothetical protein